MTTPNLSPDDERQAQLEAQAQALLRRSADELDGHTRSRLTQARKAALDSLREPKRQRATWWVPATSVAAAATLAILVSFNVTQHAPTPIDPRATLAPVDDLEIATAEDSLEFYRDVEFYAWLDTVLEDEPAADPSGA